MFGIFQRRAQRQHLAGAPAAEGNPLASFIGMNTDGRALSLRERRAVARRIETASPLDNPLSALPTIGPLAELVSRTPARAFTPPQPSTGQPAAAAAERPATGGMLW